MTKYRPITDDERKILNGIVLEDIIRKEGIENLRFDPSKFVFTEYTKEQIALKGGK